MFSQTLSETKIMREFVAKSVGINRINIAGLDFIVHLKRYVMPAHANITFGSNRHLIFHEADSITQPKWVDDFFKIVRMLA